MATRIGNMVGHRMVVGREIKPLFSFSAISDIHLHDVNSGWGYNDLTNLFRVLGNRMHHKGLNLKYVFCAGDIGLQGYNNAHNTESESDPTHEIRTFKNIVQEKCPIPTNNVFSCSGNHDQQYSTEEWKQNMFDQSLHSQITDTRNFSIIDGDFVFAFMSLARQNDRNTTISGRRCYIDDFDVDRDTDVVQENESEQTKTRRWLQNVVSEAENKTLILFMHYPFSNRKCVDTQNTAIDEYEWATGNYVEKTVKMAQTAPQYAGLIDAGGSGSNNAGTAVYGFYLKSGEQDYSTKNECEEIIAILNRHVGGKTIVFSGHTHLIFQTEDFDYVLGKGYPNVNVAPIYGTNITTVHIPSLNHPRNLTVSTKTAVDSEGADVSVPDLGSVGSWTNLSNSNPYRQPCQSWIVDVYEDRLILRGFESNVCHDKRYGDILEKYTYPIYLTDLGEDS